MSMLLWTYGIELMMTLVAIDNARTVAGGRVAAALTSSVILVIRELPNEL